MANIDQDEEIYDENEEILHEEEIDPSAAPYDDDDDVYVDTSTAGQAIYEDEVDDEDLAGPSNVEEVADDSEGGFFEHTDSVYSQHPQQPLVITGGGDDKAFIWNWQSYEKKVELVGFKESVNAVGFSMDGKYAAAADLNGEVRVWDSVTTKESVMEGPAEAIEWLDWHSKGNILLVGSADGCAYMWTVATAALMGIFAGHSGSVTCGQFTPDGKKVVTGAEDGTTRVWNPKDQQTLHTFSGHLWHTLPLTSLRVKNDNTLVITSSEDTTVCVGNLSTNRPVAKLTGHTGSVECVGFSVNQSNFVYSGSMDGTLRIWDLNTAQCRTTCTHDEATEQHGVTRLTELANMVVTASTDAVVRLWDDRTGNCVRRLTAHKDVVLVF